MFVCLLLGEREVMVGKWADGESRGMLFLDKGPWPQVLGMLSICTCVETLSIC